MSTHGLRAGSGLSSNGVLPSTLPPPRMAINLMYRKRGVKRLRPGLWPLTLSHDSRLSLCLMYSRQRGGRVSAEVTVVDRPAMPWVSGREVYDSMEPAFRENLGDPDRVGDLLSKYWIRALWNDPATSRRIDHVRTGPGYRDLSEAYHDSVEEALFLGGRATLTAEGDFQAGDYFWCPPGWVHSASSDEGFECVLMMEGESAPDGSGRVSRVVRPDEEAGRHARPGASDPIGPRGYVRRIEFCYTPKHGSWLNIAENELSSLTRQCVSGRRFADGPRNSRPGARCDQRTQGVSELFEHQYSEC
jgi:hypothetical protein